MRLMTATSLAAASLLLLAGCGKPAPKAGGEAASTAAGPAPAAPGPLTPQQIPHRKPGLWEQAVSMDGTGVGGPTMKLCVDEQSEAKMSLAAQNMPGAHCGTPVFTRNLDGSLSFTGSCDMGEGGKVQTVGTVKGDFNSSYTVSIDSERTGSPVEAMNGKHKMTVTATRLGDCAAGQKGGDMVMANGATINMLDHAPAPGGGE
jgi:hypothetical protein